MYDPFYLIYGSRNPNLKADGQHSSQSLSRISSSDLQLVALRTSPFGHHDHPPAKLILIKEVFD
jgi:hypothetical protein